MRVLSFGSLNIDYVYPVDHIIQPGETENTGGMSINCGGKGLNQSVALARAGLDVWHAGLVGDEGAILIDKCLENKINTDHIKKISGRSGHTIIQVDKDGQNSILLFGGANRRITEGFIDETLKDFGQGDYIILQNEVNLLSEIIDRAYDNKMTIVLNPSPYDETISDCDLGKVSFLIMNEVEGRQMTGENDPEQILQYMKEHYPEADTVLTLGSQGSMYQDQNNIYRQGIYEVKAVDTTAAGDTFTGYFIASIINGKAPENALKIAARASSLTVTRNGALDSIPAYEEVMAEEYNDPM